MGERAYESVTGLPTQAAETVGRAAGVCVYACVCVCVFCVPVCLVDVEVAMVTVAWACACVYL